MMTPEPRDPLIRGSGSKEDIGRRAGMWSLRVISASLLAIFLIIALGMTGGQVRQLGNRVTLLEEERSFFQRKLESFKEATVGSRKYILSDPASRDVINLELQDQLRKDLLNVTVEQDN